MIVGAGLVGLFTAFFLRKTNPLAHILVLERGAYSRGASTRNAGFACFGSVSELVDDSTHMSEAQMQHLIRMRWEGLQLSRRTIGDEHMGYKPSGNYELFGANDEALYETCVEKFDLISTMVSEAIGFKNVFSIESDTPLGLKSVHHCIFNQYEGSINTGLFYTSLLQICLKQNIRILNGVSVNEIDQSSHLVRTNLGEIQAKGVFITTNAFAGELIHDLQVAPVRNQVIVTAELPELRLNGCFHLDRGYFYIRNIGNRVLIGGGRHLLGTSETTDELGTTPQGLDLLQSKLHEFVGGTETATIDYAWSGILGVGEVKMPIIEEYAPGIFVGVRMGGMGVALSSRVGEILADFTR